MNNKIYFSKVNPDAVVPGKKDEDAGYDFYACFKEDKLKISPHEIAIIPTGIATAFSGNYVLVIKERSSTGAIGLSTRMGIIDSGYRGEIFIGLNNTTSKDIVLSKQVEQVVKEGNQIVYPYKKAIAQGIFFLLPKLPSEVIPYEDLLSIKSERMFQSLGESGK